MSLARVDHPALPGTMTEGQLDTLKRTIAHDLTDDELSLFAAVCQRTGLDPFAKQIYAIKRTTRRKVRGNWVEEDVLTIQTAIDGYRVIAERSSVYGGQDAPEWCGPDGKWTDVWLSDDPPAAAKVAVYRKDVSRPFVGVAKFDSYADRWPAKDGQKLGDLRNLWKTMPEGQIAKCAEALALRKAFPNDLSGIYTTEEMEQANTPIDATAQDRQGIPARDFDELVAASEQLTAGQLDEVKAWCADEGIELARGLLTSEGAHRVMTRILVVRSGGGGLDVPGGSPAEPPPPVGVAGEGSGHTPPDDDGGSAARPSSPPPPDSPGGGSAGSTASPVPSAPTGSPVDGGGEASVPGAQPAPTVDNIDLERELLKHSPVQRSTPAAKNAVVKHAAERHGFQGTFPELLADERQALTVLRELGGTIPGGPDTAAAVDVPDFTPWKQLDPEAWDKWRKGANAKAGPGTKAKPHPRLLDEAPDYDLQRHAMAFQVSRRQRGVGCEVTSWSELTEREAMAIWNPERKEGALQQIEDGGAGWGFTDEALSDEVQAATGGWWLSLKAKEQAA